MQNLLAHLPRFLLLGFLINGIFGRKFPKSLVNLIAVGSVVLSFGWVMKVFLTAGDLGAAPVTEHYYTWIKSGEFQVGWDFAVDKLTMIMLMIRHRHRFAHPHLRRWGVHGAPKRAITASSLTSTCSCFSC